jgi:hypothetical protein
MTALSIQPPFPIFSEADGSPLEDGYIWIGTANLNPITNPINVYWDAALTLPAAQPIRTQGGYPVNSGTPTRLYVNSDYSIQVQDKNGSVVYSAPAATERLSDVVVTGVDSSEVTFLQAGTGAVTRTAQSKMRDVVSVKDFGAVGNGVADDTAAMQAAHNTGQIVYYPPGTYKFTTLTSITAGGIIGAGQTQTILLSTNTTSADLITFTGPSVGGPQNSLTFRDFMLQGQAPTKTAGAGIKIAPATSDNIYAFASNVTVSYVPTGFDFVRASFFKLIACNLLAYSVAGVQVANANNNDAGDSEIIGCAFSTPYSGGSFSAGVKHLSSGGLRIVGNKFLGGNYGYWLNYTDSDGAATNTSIVIISGNSIENFHTNAISLTKVSASLTSFKNVVIADNEIAVALATPSAFLIASDSGAWLQSVTITGNVLQLPGVTNSYGITLVGVTCLNITGNTFRGNGGTSEAIGLTSCVDVKIGTNVYSNITTPYVLTTPGANNSVLLDSQSGTATSSASGWSAYYGSLYIGPTTTVTFAQPFQVTPQASDVMFSLASGDGSVSAVVSSVSKTQLSFNVVASRTPGFAAVVNWKVFGVL